RTGRRVLERDALRGELVADPVGGGEVAAAARGLALGDARVDARVALAALRARERPAEVEAEDGVEGAQERAPLRRGEVAVARALPGDGERARGVQVLAQRVAEALAQRARADGVDLAAGVAHRGGVAEQAVVAGRGGFDRLVGEGLLLAVVRLEEEVAEGER